MSIIYMTAMVWKSKQAPVSSLHHSATSADKNRQRDFFIRDDLVQRLVAYTLNTTLGCHQGIVTATKTAAKFYRPIAAFNITCISRYCDVIGALIPNKFCNSFPYIKSHTTQAQACTLQRGFNSHMLCSSHSIARTYNRWYFSMMSFSRPLCDI